MKTKQKHNEVDEGLAQGPGIGDSDSTAMEVSASGERESESEGILAMPLEEDLSGHSGAVASSTPIATTTLKKKNIRVQDATEHAKTAERYLADFKAQLDVAIAANESGERLTFLNERVVMYENNVVLAQDRLAYENTLVVDSQAWSATEHIQDVQGHLGQLEAAKRHQARLKTAPSSVKTKQRTTGVSAQQPLRQKKRKGDSILNSTVSISAMQDGSGAMADATLGQEYTNRADAAVDQITVAKELIAHLHAELKKANEQNANEEDLILIRKSIAGSEERLAALETSLATAKTLHLPPHVAKFSVQLKTVLAGGGEKKKRRAVAGQNKQATKRSRNFLPFQGAPPAEDSKMAEEEEEVDEHDVYRFLDRYLYDGYVPDTIPDHKVFAKLKHIAVFCAGRRGEDDRSLAMIYWPPAKSVEFAQYKNATARMLISRFGRLFDINDVTPIAPDENADFPNYAMQRLFEKDDAVLLPFLEQWAGRLQRWVAREHDHGDINPAVIFGGIVPNLARKLLLEKAFITLVPNTSSFDVLWFTVAQYAVGELKFRAIEDAVHPSVIYHQTTKRAWAEASEKVDMSYGALEALRRGTHTSADSLTNAMGGLAKERNERLERALQELEIPRDDSGRITKKFQRLRLVPWTAAFVDKLLALKVDPDFGADLVMRLLEKSTLDFLQVDGLEELIAARATLGPVLFWKASGTGSFYASLARGDFGKERSVEKARRRFSEAEFEAAILENSAYDSLYSEDFLAQVKLEHEALPTEEEFGVALQDSDFWETVTEEIAASKFEQARAVLSEDQLSKAVGNDGFFACAGRGKFAEEMAEAHKVLSDAEFDKAVGNGGFFASAGRGKLKEEMAEVRKVLTSEQILKAMGRDSFFAKLAGGKFVAEMKVAKEILGKKQLSSALNSDSFFAMLDLKEFKQTVQFWQRMLGVGHFSSACSCGSFWAAMSGMDKSIAKLAYHAAEDVLSLEELKKAMYADAFWVAFQKDDFVDKLYASVPPEGGRAGERFWQSLYK